MDSIYHTNSQKLYLTVLTLLCIFMSACSPLFSNRTPYDYPDSIWESKDPIIHLYVKDEDPNNADEYIILDGEVIPIVFFGGERSSYGMIIRKNSFGNYGDVLFDVEWKCYEDKIIITIVKDYYTEKLENKKITLYRIDEELLQNKNAGG